MCMINRLNMFKDTFSGPRSILEMSIQFLLISSKSSKTNKKWPRGRFRWKKWYPKTTFKNSSLTLQMSFLYIRLLSTSLWSTWRIIKNVILLLISRKNTSSTLERKDLSTKHGENIFRTKEDNCTILYIKFVNIRISKLEFSRN